MNAVTLSSAHLTSAVTSANTLGGAIGGTFSGNAGWFILLAAGTLIIGIVLFIMQRISHLGSTGNMMHSHHSGHHSRQDQHLSNLLNSKEARRKQFGN